jgi:hypothetical protein
VGEFAAETLREQDVVDAMLLGEANHGSAPIAAG